MTDLFKPASEFRPDLKAQTLRVSQTERELELACRLQVPDVTVSVGYASDAGNVAKDTGLFDIGIPPAVLYQFQGEIGKVAAELNEAKLRQELGRNAIRNEVLSVWWPSKAHLRLWLVACVNLIKKSSRYVRVLSLLTGKALLA